MLPLYFPFLIYAFYLTFVFGSVKNLFPFFVPYSFFMALMIFLPFFVNGIVTSPFGDCIASWIVPLFAETLKTLGF
jgi:hypothetical protein